jgi:ankyrin repeat protein
MGQCISDTDDVKFQEIKQSHKVLDMLYDALKNNKLDTLYTIVQSIKKGLYEYSPDWTLVGSITTNRTFKLHSKLQKYTYYSSYIEKNFDTKTKSKINITGIKPIYYILLNYLMTDNIKYLMLFKELYPFSCCKYNDRIYDINLYELLVIVLINLNDPSQHHMNFSMRGDFIKYLIELTDDKLESLPMEKTDILSFVIKYDDYDLFEKLCPKAQKLIASKPYLHLVESSTVKEPEKYIKLLTKTYNKDVFEKYNQEYPFNIALQNKHLESIKYYLNNYPVDVVLAQDKFILHKIVQITVDVTILRPVFTKLLAKDKTLVDVKNELDQSLLHIACEQGDIKLIKLLIDFEANTNVVNRHKKTPFDILTERGYYSQMAQLMRYFKLE